MSATIRAISILALGLGASCVGSLNNDPYLPGTARVEGRISAGIAAADAWVVVLGHPELVAAIGADGRFTIEGVPTGEVELAASTGLGQAAREQLLVLRDVENRVELTPVAGASAEGLAILEGQSFSRRVEVRIAGLPTRVLASSSGHFTLGSLPPGCFTLWADHVTHRQGEAELCLVAGETSSVDLQLAAQPDAATDAALCSPCQDSSACASGWCFAHLEEEESEQVCSTGCAEDADCPPGYRCEEDELDPGSGACLPHEVSCSARANFGAPCDASELCGLSESDGVCLEGRCTFECDSDLDCPDDTRCGEQGEPDHTLCL